MKRLWIVLLILLMAVSLVYAKGFEVKKKAGEYSVEIEIDKNPPTVGKNNMKIEIKDSSGNYVTDASVKILYSMPAMPGMPPMNYKTEAVLSGKEYRAVLDISMSGPWNIEVRISKGGKTSTVKFNVDAR
jgi:hypothetical protein